MNKIFQYLLTCPCDLLSISVTILDAKSCICNELNWQYINQICKKITNGFVATLIYVLLINSLLYILLHLRKHLMCVFFKMPYESPMSILFNKSIICNT